MTSKLHKSLRIILPLLLGGLLIVLLYRKVDFEVVRSTLTSDVRWEIIALTCLLGPISVLFRALRWDLQVEPLRREGMGSTLAPPSSTSRAAMRSIWRSRDSGISGAAPPCRATRDSPSPGSSGR